jgi:alkanesulfonate monooxygenase SsuD/methylene tetrahydromethanopterin reductase-like flavin-dependent oxidoreductase (luciferase family)
MNLRFGVRHDLVGELPPGVAVTDLYAALIEHAVAADRLGLDVLWISERPFVPGSYAPAALPLCAAVAARTVRVRIGAGVLPLPLHHPLKVAEDAATLDAISAGRAELALGLGSREAFDAFGFAVRERAGRFEEALQLIRLAFGAGPIDFAGEHFAIEAIDVHPKPVQAGGPPLWVGGDSESAATRAARAGAGLFARSAEGARAFRVALRAAGVDPARARLALDLGLDAEDSGAARDRIAAALEAVSDFGDVDLLVAGLAPEEVGGAPSRRLEALCSEVLPEFRRRHSNGSV